MKDRAPSHLKQLFRKHAPNSCRYQSAALHSYAIEINILEVPLHATFPVRTGFLNVAVQDLRGSPVCNI